VLERRLAVAVAALALTASGCHASSAPAVQAGVTNGGLSAGEVGAAQQIAIREVRQQHIDLDAAVALSHTKTSRHDGPRSGSCPTGPLIRVVLEGSFPMQSQAVEAEEIYANPLSGHLGICSRTYLHAVPVLPKDLGTLYVPGTRSRGE
jgi:hypothetical protein